MNDLDSISTLHKIAQKRTKTRYRVAPKAAPALRVRCNITNNVIFKFYEDSVTGNALRTGREEAKLTQQEAASRLGLTQAYLSMLERGRRPVTTELAAQAIKVFHLPPTALPLEAEFRTTLDENAFKAELGALGYRASPTCAESLTTILLDCCSLPSTKTALIEGWWRHFPGWSTRIREWIGSGSHATPS